MRPNHPSGAVKPGRVAADTTHVDTNVSRPVRIVALAGFALALAGGGYTLTLGRSGSEPVPVPPPARTHTTASPAAPARPAAHATPAKPATKPSARAAKPATTKPATKPAVAHRGNLVDSRLPAPLQWALSQHRIVVVALYNPHADVDAIAVAEAHAGAVDAKAGFLLVNVMNDKVAGILTGLLPGGGLLPDPGVLVYRAPGTVAFRLDGFQDRDAVAQAAVNAAAGQTDTSGSAATP